MSTAKAIALVDNRTDRLWQSGVALGLSVIIVNLVSLIVGVLVPLILER